jgi:hypothetical protein
MPSCPTPEGKRDALETRPRARIRPGGRRPKLTGPLQAIGAYPTPLDLAERLQDLWRRCAASENWGTLRTIAEPASELALTAPENILDDIDAA